MVKWLRFWINPFSKKKSNNSHSLNCQYVILILMCFIAVLKTDVGTALWLQNMSFPQCLTRYVHICFVTSVECSLTQQLLFSIHNHQIWWPYCIKSLSYVIVSVRLWSGAVTRSLPSVNAETMYVHSGLVLGSCLIHKAISMRRRSVK